MSEYLHGPTLEGRFVEHEHLELRRGINRIHDVAMAIGTIAAPDLSITLLDVLDWVDRVLEPHASWEDRWLYPEVDRQAGTPWATKLMVFEHQQIRQIAQRIAADRTLLNHEPTREQAGELRGRLFALETLIRAHMEREDRFLIPLLHNDAPAAARGQMLAAGSSDR
jgi:hemerythrin-like domain-containing protein